jgi:hypothetical protein
MVNVTLPLFRVPVATTATDPAVERVETETGSLETTEPTR